MSYIFMPHDVVNKIIDGYISRMQAWREWKEAIYLNKNPGFSGFDHKKAE